MPGEFEKQGDHIFPDVVNVPGHRADDNSFSPGWPFVGFEGMKSGLDGAGGEQYIGDVEVRALKLCGYLPCGRY